MPAPVAWQKHHVDARKTPEQKLVRRLTPRRAHALPARVLKPVDAVDSAAADHAKDSSAHGKVASGRKRRFVSLEWPRAIGFTGRAARMRGTRRGIRQSGGDVPMKSRTKEIATIKRLEMRLQLPSVRSSKKQLNQLLADDFMEF